MDTKQQLDTAKNRGFLKAATDNGMSPLQALAFLKLAFELDPATAGLVNQSPEFQNYVHGQWQDHGMEQLKGTPFAHLAGAGKDAFGTVALGTGGLGLMYLLGANAKKRDAEQESQYPMKVTYGG